MRKIKILFYRLRFRRLCRAYSCGRISWSELFEKLEALNRAYGVR